jgi:hypothetical protein
MLAGYSGTARSSESDPWTYAYIPLANSAALVSDRLANSIQTVIDGVNSEHTGKDKWLEDTALEFAFFAKFRSRHIRDVAWGLFERCIGTNSCAEWPQFERIQMYPEESVYHAGRWRFIPARFHLASVINVCGVRMGADKLTHFFDDGFHYFNALRSRRKNLDPEDIRQLSMAFEQSYMGTRLTGIVSRADIEANLAGVHFYSDFFSGTAPMIGRNSGGHLIMLRNPDICDYVTDQFDERILPNEYVYGLLDTPRARDRSRNLMKIIEERGRLSESLARELSDEELTIQKNMIMARRIPMTRWQREFPKLRLAGHATGILTHLLFDSGFRRASSIFGFNPFKPRKLLDRKPIIIQRTELVFDLRHPKRGLRGHI